MSEQRANLLFLFQLPSISPRPLYVPFQPLRTSPSLVGDAALDIQSHFVLAETLTSK